MLSKTLKVIVGFVLLAPAALAQQPYYDWEAAYNAAEELVSSWSIEQRANISVRYGTAPGYIPFTITDGPTGVAGAVGVSGWISPQTLAFSWDPEIIYEQHAAMALEFKDKGYSAMAGPVTGPLGRSVFSGRLFENFGSDPYLNGKLFAEAIKGVQDEGVIAGGKHYLANEQETRRQRGNSSSNIDDRTVHELYLWPWADGVEAGMGSAMCSMNAVNGIVGCESDYLLTELLKSELGFKGFLVPDVTVPVNRTRSLVNGLDWNSGYTLAQIMTEINAGRISEKVMTDHALRIVATMFNFNMPQTEFADTTASKNTVVRRADTPALMRKAGSESIILLKNEKKTLPLSKGVKSIAVFGLDAQVNPLGPVGQANFGSYEGDTYAGHLIGGGGSAMSPAPYIISPLDSIVQRAAGQDFNLRYIISDNHTVSGSAGSVTVQGFASISEHCLVFINAFAKEGADRRLLADPTGDKLVNDVARFCANTTVVMNTAGVRLVDEWIEHPNVTAVLNAGTLGQESGNAITDVLFGDVNPSGKLVYTVAKSGSDYNGAICQEYDCDYTEGLFIDYRHFDKEKIEPRYEFGYGLSYTTFSYSDFKVKTPCTKTLKAWSSGPSGAGGRADLWTTVVKATATITNNGSVAGAEVAQLYVTMPESADAPVMQLRGFKKVFLEPGQSKTVSFTLQRRDLSVWDVDEQNWKISSGAYKLHLAKSSRKVETSHSLALKTS